MYIHYITKNCEWSKCKCKSECILIKTDTCCYCCSCCCFQHVAQFCIWDVGSAVNANGNVNDGSSRRKSVCVPPAEASASVPKRETRIYFIQRATRWSRLQLIMIMTMAIMTACWWWSTPATWNAGVDDAALRVFVDLVWIGLASGTSCRLSWVQFLEREVSISSRANACPSREEQPKEYIDIPPPIYIYI